MAADDVALDASTDGGDVSALLPLDDAAGAVDLQTDFQLQTDLQVQDAVESLQQLDGIRPDAWAALDAAGRLETLQDVEQRMAEIQGRPPVEVMAEDMDPNTYGGWDGSLIRLNAQHLASSDMPVAEVVNTIIHEGRHAYQDYAVAHPGFVPDGAVVAAWAVNMHPGNYLRLEDYGPLFYGGQPVEADAWEYAGRVTTALGTTKPQLR